MMRSFRAFFLSRALREKVLLVAFVGIGALWWGSAFTTRLTTFWREQRSTSATLTEQQMWIKNQTTIEQTAEKTAARLDPARTLNGNQLVTNVHQIAREAGLQNTNTSGNTSATSGQFAVHSVEYNILRADWEALSKFYSALQKRSPYISVERFILTAAPNNPAQLTLNLKVVSVEILR